MIYSKLKILFIGSVKFSFDSLNSLITNNFEIVGVVTKKESKINSDFYDLSEIANNNNIPIFYRTKENQDDLELFVKSKNPNIIYCFGWSHLLSKNILSIPKFGVIGFHPAELPNNRGRHPIIWALFLGLKKTSSTFFIMDEGADTGDIISQKNINIKNDDAYTLYAKITEVAIKQIRSFTKEFESNGKFINRIKQNINEGNSWRKRNKNDGKIDFRMSCQAIINLVKALTKPYVGAHVEFEGEEIKIWKVKEEKKFFDNNEPGKILKIEDGDIIVKAYDGAVRIIDHDFKKFPLINNYL